MVFRKKEYLLLSDQQFQSKFRFLLDAALNRKITVSIVISCSRYLIHKGGEIIHDAMHGHPQTLRCAVPTQLLDAERHAQLLRLE